jgi:hypothetical protein
MKADFPLWALRSVHGMVRRESAPGFEQDRDIEWKVSSALFDISFTFNNSSHELAKYSLVNARGVVI